MSSTSTYDASPPLQPGATTFNGIQKIDDPNPLAPALNPQTDPNSAEYNMLCALSVAFAAVIPTAIVGVTGGVTPAVNTVISPIQAVSGNLAAFTLTRTSAGVVWIEWATSTTLPAQRGQPTATLNVTLGANTYAIAAVYGTGPAHGFSAVQVTTTQGGVLTDLSFCVSMF